MSWTPTIKFLRNKIKLSGRSVNKKHEDKLTNDQFNDLFNKWERGGCLCYRCHTKINYTIRKGCDAISADRLRNGNSDYEYGNVQFSHVCCNTIECSWRRAKKHPTPKDFENYLHKRRRIKEKIIMNNTIKVTVGSQTFNILNADAIEIVQTLSTMVLRNDLKGETTSNVSSTSTIKQKMKKGLWDKIIPPAIEHVKQNMGFNHRPRDIVNALYSLNPELKNKTRDSLFSALTNWRKKNVEYDLA